MLPKLVSQFMAPLEAGGYVARSGMVVYINQSYLEYSKSSNFTVGLYTSDAVFENTIDSLHCMMNDMGMHDSPWFPVADGKTLEEAFLTLEAKLQAIVDGKHTDDWFSRVYRVSFNFTECDARDARYEFDPNEYKLYEAFS